VVRNYELDRTISHTRLATGTLRRLSIAVVVDDKLVAGDNGETTAQPWSDEELARFTELVKKAVGFDPRRGDSVQVINASFQPVPEPEPLPDPPLWEQPWFWPLVKQVLAGLGGRRRNPTRTNWPRPRRWCRRIRGAWPRSSRHG